jgi:predicted acylesterase/phospholipase RssA
MKVDFLEMNERGGVIHCEKIKDMLIPLLLAYDIPLDITIKQAHDRSSSNIELHIFSTNLENFKRVDFNVETFPDMPLMTACMLSCAVPPIFTVGVYENITYADGGLSDNFPLAALLENGSKPDPSTVLCINMAGPLNKYTVGSPLIDLMTYLINHVILKMCDFYINHDLAKSMCKHYICHESESIWSKTLWDKFLYSEDGRKQLYDKGIELAKTHIKSLTPES